MRLSRLFMLLMKQKSLFCSINSTNYWIKEKKFLTVRLS
jgi:hypothetical protein